MYLYSSLYLVIVFKVLIEFVTILHPFYVLFLFGPEVYEILAPGQGSKPAPSALEGQVLTPGPAGKSLNYLLVSV